MTDRCVRHVDVGVIGVMKERLNEGREAVGEILGR
jgi:hypothetical protein